MQGLWHHWLDGHEFGQAPGIGDRQGSLVCCSSWGCKESDTTERLNWTESLWVGIPESCFPCELCFGIKRSILSPFTITVCLSIPFCCQFHIAFEGYVQFGSIQSLSRVWLFATPWTAAHQASLSITNSRSLFELMSIEWVMLSNHLYLCCCPLLLPQSYVIRHKNIQNFP